MIWSVSLHGDDLRVRTECEFTLAINYSSYLSMASIDQLNSLPCQVCSALFARCLDHCRVAERTAICGEQIPKGLVFWNSKVRERESRENVRTLFFPNQNFEGEEGKAREGGKAEWRRRGAEGFVLQRNWYEVRNS